VDFVKCMLESKRTILLWLLHLVAAIEVCRLCLFVYYVDSGGVLRAGGKPPGWPKLLVDSAERVGQGEGESVDLRFLSAD
jgi:hypothetical protein